MLFNVHIPAVNFTAEIKRDPTINERFPVVLYINEEEYNCYLDREDAMQAVDEIARSIANSKAVSIKRAYRRGTFHTKEA